VLAGLGFGIGRSTPALAGALLTIKRRDPTKIVVLFLTAHQSGRRLAGLLLSLALTAVLAHDVVAH